MTPCKEGPSCMLMFETDSTYAVELVIEGWKKLSTFVAGECGQLQWLNIHGYILNCQRHSNISSNGGDPKSSKFTSYYKLKSKVVSFHSGSYNFEGPPFFLVETSTRSTGKTTCLIGNERNIAVFTIHFFDQTIWTEN